MKISGLKVVVLGCGKSGLESAYELKRRGASVLVSELGGVPQRGCVKADLKKRGIECEFGGHNWSLIKEADLVIVSPGIPPKAEIMQKLSQSNIKVWSEIELAYRLSNSQIIAVTGTCGKSTVTTLIHQILTKTGLRAVLCGNIGNPFIGEISRLDPESIVVLEVSSFQLAHIHRFKPHVAVWLNVSPNHLDWHSNYEDYVTTKLRMFENQDVSDFAVLNGDDSEIRSKAVLLKSQVVYFDQNLDSNLNTSAISKVCGLYGVTPEEVDREVSRFQGLEHRFESLGEIQGVHYINDSKSTTVQSLRWALGQLKRNIILICGGRHKSGDFGELSREIHSQVKLLIAIGEAKTSLEHAFGDVTRILPVESLKEAVALAVGNQKAGDTVLFSPACASFDMFENYEDRGRQFKALIRKEARVLEPT